MVYYNLKVMVVPLSDIQHERTYEKLANLLSLAMLQDPQLKELHEKNQYKLYHFCSLYPFEKDGVYRKGRMYSFDIRFVEMNFALKMKQLLAIVKSPEFKVVMSHMETNEYRKIHKLVSLTPSIITTLKGDYKIEGDMNLVKQRLIAGAEKKYQLIYGDILKADFIESIRQTNIKPIKIPYKSIHFLGYKFEIDIKQDEASQKLAYVLLSTGALEKNAIGFGFCKAR